MMGREKATSPLALTSSSRAARVMKSTGDESGETIAVVTGVGLVYVTIGSEFL